MTHNLGEKGQKSVNVLRRVAVRVAVLPVSRMILNASLIQVAVIVSLRMGRVELLAAPWISTPGSVFVLHHRAVQMAIRMLVD